MCDCNQTYYLNDCGCSDDNCNPCSEKCKCTNNRTSDQIFYKGPELLCLDVQNCQSLTEIIQMMDAKICALQNALAGTTTSTTTLAPVTTSTTTTSAPVTTTTTTTVAVTTSTTTTIIEACMAYILEATEDNASWTALDCDDVPVGGVIALSGQTTNTGCVKNTTLEVTGANIIYSEVCVSTTTTTTTETPLDCTLAGEGAVIEGSSFDCVLAGEGEIIAL